MTFSNTEVKQPEQQETKVDTNLLQTKVDTTLSQQKIDSPDQNQSIETQEDPNWRAFREARKKDRLEREAAERKAAEKEKEIAALKEAMEAAFGKGNHPNSQSYQQYYGITQNENEETEEQKIERKINELLIKKEEQYKKQQQESELREYPTRLQRDFPDFSYVCSQENLDYLDYHYPEISRPLQRLSEGYDKWSDIYHAVKKLIPNHSTAKKEAAKAEINSNKPKSMSSIDAINPGQPVRESWQQSEQRRAENWARMQRIMKGVG